MMADCVSAEQSTGLTRIVDDVKSAHRVHKKAQHPKIQDRIVCGCRRLGGFAEHSGASGYPHFAYHSPRALGVRGAQPRPEINTVKTVGVMRILLDMQRRQD